MTRILALTVSVAIAAAATGSASGAIGIYGIVERVVFEPDERTPTRVQVWGAFAYADGRSPQISSVQRGYLYFRIPDFRDSADIVRREWADLKALSGTGQAVGFGEWGYIGNFTRLRPEADAKTPPSILEWAAQGGATTDMRVRPASEKPTRPAAYHTNAGVVKLSDTGSHAGLVKQLRAALTR